MNKYSFSNIKSLYIKYQNLTLVQKKYVKKILFENEPATIFSKNLNGYICNFHLISDKSIYLIYEYFKTIDESNNKHVVNISDTINTVNEIKKIKKTKLTNEDQHIINRTQYEKDIKNSNQETYDILNNISNQNN